jgi:hypothetical protein
MTQDLRGHATPPNLPTKFHLMCTRCGRRTDKVKFSLRAKANICQPNCPKTN